MQYAVDKGLMNGTSETAFTPNGDTTRGMVVTILYRLAGSPEVESDGAAWWSDARAWAMEKGVSDGTDMEAPITREQLAAMMYRYADFLGMDTAASGSLTCRLRGNASRQQTEGREQSRPRNLNSKHRIQIYQNRILIYPPNPRPK